MAYKLLIIYVCQIADMKRILFILIDFIIIYGSILLAFYLLKNINMLEDFQRNFEAFKIVYPSIGVLYLLLMYAFELYDISRKEFSEVIYIVSLVSVSLMIGIMGVCFFVRDVALAFPRSVILISFVFYLILLLFKSFLYWYLS